MSSPGFSPRPLRPWQAEAIRAYEQAHPADFLVTATPGAGKTTFALTLASRLHQKRLIDRLVVVVPTDHLRQQWADAADRFGIAMDPALANDSGPLRQGTFGYVTTYAQVASKPAIHFARVTNKRTLVILDEVHHAGDALSWGDGIREAFSMASRRLCLTGTPFRTKPDERIPFVRYEETDEELSSVADYAYEYREALRDGVVRPVVFAAYSGTSRWMNSAGEVLSASLSDAGSKKKEEAAWRTALNPEGKWIPHVIAAADQRLSDLRESGMPDAAALMLATDQAAAREYARLVKQVTGHKAVLVLSDDPTSSKRIAAFNSSDDRWIVAVRQVSEGVDIARLAVCVWTTSYRTPLFFAQAVGRVVRSRATTESATVFLPAVRPLLALAADMEESRNSVMKLAPGKELDEFERVESEPGLPDFIPLDSEAEFAHVLHGGAAHTADTAPASDEHDDFLGLPGLLTPEQTATLLALRDAQLRRQRPVELDVAGDGASWRDIEALRREVQSLARTWAGRSGRAHKDVHVELRKAVPGPSSATAPIEVLEARRDYLLGKVG